MIWCGYVVYGTHVMYHMFEQTVIRELLPNSDKNPGNPSPGKKTTEFDYRTLFLFNIGEYAGQGDCQNIWIGKKIISAWKNRIWSVDASLIFRWAFRTLSTIDIETNTSLLNEIYVCYKKKGMRFIAKFGFWYFLFV